MLASILFSLLLALALAAPAPGLPQIDDFEKSFKDILAHHKAERVTTASADPVVTTRSELKQGKCNDVIVIFARGTTEPGNVGDDVGPYFFDALSEAMPRRVIVQGVDNYKADAVGYFAGGSNSGAKDMANSVKLAVKQCPKSKIVLSGFSQGAQVTHKAAKLIPENQRAYVGAIVLFGDPFNGDGFPGTLNDNVKTFCRGEDLICYGLPIPTDAHANYEDDAPEAAAFVASVL